MDLYILHSCGVKALDEGVTGSKVVKEREEADVRTFFNVGRDKCFLTWLDIIQIHPSYQSQLLPF